MRRVWTLTLAMRDIDAEEGYEITFRKVIGDIDASRLALDVVVIDAAREGVERVLRQHRKLTVGEE